MEEIGRSDGRPLAHPKSRHERSRGPIDKGRTKDLGRGPTKDYGTCGEDDHGTPAVTQGGRKKCHKIVGHIVETT